MKLEGAPLKPVGEPVSHSVSTSVLGEEKQSLEAASVRSPTAELVCLRVLTFLTAYVSVLAAYNWSCLA